MEIIDPKKTKERMDERLEMMHKLYSNSEVKHIFSPSEPMTNAERIRSMTNAELAEFFASQSKIGESWWLDWLQQEV